MDDKQIAVCVVYALPDRQAIVRLNVPSGTTIGDAVRSSGLSARFPEIARGELSCAVYGRVVATSEPVAHDDRIEILRPLLIDPKESRRRAAARARRSGR